MRRIPVLIASALLAAAALALWHGVRLPPPRLDPAARPNEATSAHGIHVTAQGASFVGERDDTLVFRAHVPEPSLTFEASRDGEVRVSLENVHPEATARLTGAARSRSEVVTRSLDFPLAAGARATAAFSFPERTRYRFAAVGDTGGSEALRSFLERARALGADFVLHLGDVGYTPDAFPRAAETLRATPLPVFAAIGNHDYGKGLDPSEVFTRTLGPRNSAFTLAGVTFVNLDTASDTWLPMRGRRGVVLRELAAARERLPGPVVVFTHRPLHDPRVATGQADKPHALNSAWEADWLRDTLKDLGAVALLAGHIHWNIDFVDDGLPTWISGMGLGHAVADAEVAPPDLLIGEFAPGGPVGLRWVPAD